MENRHQGIFASPEMCLKHEEFWKYLADTKFKGLCAIIVDEMHCILQWGGDFQKAYGELLKLWAFFLPHIPILGTSATAPPPALQEIQVTLLINAETSFFLILSNDCPNLSFEVHQLNSGIDFDALQPYLMWGPNPSSPDDIIKGIVFTNSVISTQLSTQKIHSWLPHHLCKQVAYLHALHTPHVWKCVMKQFWKGKIKILVATEAAGMVWDLSPWSPKILIIFQGADIPDIEQVIQFGVPPSLSVWCSMQVMLVDVLVSMLRHCFS